MNNELKAFSLFFSGTFIIWL